MFDIRNTSTLHSPPILPNFDNTSRPNYNLEVAMQVEFYSLMLFSDSGFQIRADLSRIKVPNEKSKALEAMFASQKLTHSQKLSMKKFLNF